MKKGDFAGESKGNRDSNESENVIWFANVVRLSMKLILEKNLYILINCYDKISNKFI